MRKITILSYTFFLLLLLSIGCEKITDDTLPSSDSTGSTGSQKIFYALQDNEIAIELKQLVTSFDVKSLNIKELPEHGKAVFSSEGILTYTPNENITNADEQLSIAYEKKDGSTVEDKIVIKIVSENFDFPCINIAMPDKVKTLMNNAVVIDVLKNDLVCEGTLQGIAKIVNEPKEGTAIIENKKIKYTPKNGFKGEDAFLYSITISNNGKTETRLAFVQIEVNTPNVCTTQLRNDIIFLKPQNPKDSLIIKVLVNDKLCEKDFPPAAGLKVAIDKKPNFGKATVLQDKFITYKLNFPPPQPTGQPLLDSIVYKLTSTSSGTITTYKATVYIKEEKPNSNCKPLGEQGNFIFSLKNLVGKESVEVDVLKNAYFCPNSKFASLKVVSVLPKNADLVVTNDNKVRYTPTNKKFNKETVSFLYEITDDKGMKSQFPTSVTIKFVD
jgi:hypothetical protein